MRKISRKQQVINELMEGNTYAFPQIIRAKIEKKSLSVIEYYIHMTPNNKKLIIDNIIRIG